MCIITPRVVYTARVCTRFIYPQGSPGVHPEGIEEMVEERVQEGAIYLFSFTYSIVPPIGQKVTRVSVWPDNLLIFLDNTLIDPYSIPSNHVNPRYIPMNTYT